MKHTMSVDSMSSERSTNASVKTGRAVFSMRTMAGTPSASPATFWEPSRVIVWSSGSTNGLSQGVT